MHTVHREPTTNAGCRRASTRMGDAPPPGQAPSRVKTWLCNVATMATRARLKSPGLLRFRRARPADVGSIVSLVNAAYRGEDLGGWTTEAHLVGVRRADAEVVQEVVAAPNGLILLAEIGSGPAGCVQLTKRDDSVELGMLAVQPELQDRGIGRSIMREAEQVCCDELGAKEIRLQVLYMRSDIIAWYERLGYRRNGERAPFPYGDERVGVPQRADLEFAVFTKALD
jgi:ribosomal protein S18 acetylase RimI-like enzyme